MKGVFGIIIVFGIIAFVANAFLSREAMRDQGRPIAVAWGAPTPTTLEMQIGVAPLVVLNDPPEVNEKGVQRWNEWVPNHYQLREENGPDVPLRKIGTSALMLGEKAAGVPEFVLCADLKKGGKHVCDFIPVVAEGKRYRYSFVVPNEPPKVGRELFELVVEK